MNTQRMYKEARPLFWAWCAVVLAAIVPLIHTLKTISWICELGFFAGLVLLATLPFGNEFQYRTFSLLLSQPISRMQIWREKLSITAIAVFTAALIFFCAGRASGIRTDREAWAYGAAAAIVFVASAPFWTLFTRSTVGGVVLSFGVYIFIFVLGGLVLFWGRGYSKLAASTFRATMSFVSLGYAGLMLWLGWRKLARFQLTGSAAGDDLLTAGAGVMPGALAGWLRCQPSGAVLNLIRKEIRLLRPVWLFTVLGAVGWTWLMAAWLPHHRTQPTGFAAALMIGMSCSLIIPILAGSSSLGEERSSGTHAWHLTLPAPALLQWGVKLCMALFAGFVGAWLLPALIAGRFFFETYSSQEKVSFTFGVLLLTFAAFWCACAVNGTVRAVLWVFPVMIVLYLAGELGKWVGPLLTNRFCIRFDPFANVKFAATVSRFGATAFFKLIQAASTNMTDSVQAALVLTITVLVPTLFYAAIQSYRLFRAQVPDRALSVVRSLFPLAMIAFLCNSSALAFYTFVDRAALDPKWTAVFEARGAIQKIQRGVAKLDAAHPLQLTVEDLAKAYPLSESTRRFLKDSRITLSLEEPPHGRFGCVENAKPYGLSSLRYSWYSAIIPFPDGSHVFVAFDPVTHYTISAGLCGGPPPRFPVGVH